MRLRMKDISTVLLFLILAAACNLPSGGLPVTGPNGDETLEALGPTPPASEVVQGFNTQVETATPEAAVVEPGNGAEAATATLSVPHLIAVQEMNVRDGPGTYYLTLGVLPQNQTAVVTGQAAPYGALYWRIECPQGVSGEQCWVSSGAEFTRAVNVQGVPDVDSPPPPAQRDDVPPEGVAAQLGYFIPFIQCQPFLTAGAPGIDISVEVLEGRLVCLDGFGPEGEIQIRILRSDGSEIKVDSIEPLSIGSNGYTLQVPPGEPLGQYTVVARQGDLEAVGTFELIPSTTERLIVLPLRDVPGATFQIGVGGMADGTTIHLYRLEPTEGSLPYRYVTMLGRVRVNTDSGGVFTYRSAPDDPPGEYLVASESGAAKAPFSLQAP